MMLLIFLLQLINICEGLSGGVEYETLCTSNACFTLHMDRVSFEDARLNCVDNGGYLMTVGDRAEEAVLRSLLSRIDRRRQDRLLKFWIGLKLHKGDCVLPDRTLRGFKWVSEHEDTQYSNWEREPVSTCTEERCVAVRYTLSGQNSLKWIAGPCKGPAYYACKFYFKGMCKPLALLGPGQVNYTAPFSAQPLRNDMKSLPLGTYAIILCGEHQSHYSVCMAIGDSYSWTDPGPFCRVGKQNCTFNNGGCEHLCLEDTDGVRCACKEGYELGQDKLSCRIKDFCGDYTCEHQCVTGESGYSCACLQGFELDANQWSCSDINECQMQACEDHLCVNTHGSYTCACREGYEMFGGKCRDVDECNESRCEQSCLNSLGSFSCHCTAGFTVFEDGHSCVDIDECINNRCEFNCTNTFGSFLCTCPRNFHLDSNGITCTPDLTDTSTAASSSESDDRESHEKITESLTTMEVQHQTPHTDAPLPDSVSVIMRNDPQGNVSLGTIVQAGKPLNSRVLICVLGSVIPLLLLVAVTLAIAIFRCGRSKREAKKMTTADGYCWVSSGLEPHLEKLYESILTDDL
ncbi:complement component C1q receptor [Centroberyx affinis]|uniref:complement component C1q receptor n=1 Tax=Centroberyx affinis TaxID=166261 RepID=UPI003A5BEF16